MKYCKNCEQLVDPQKESDGEENKKSNKKAIGLALLIIIFLAGLAWYLFSGPMYSEEDAIQLVKDYGGGKGGPSDIQDVIDEYKTNFNFGSWSASKSDGSWAVSITYWLKGQFVETQEKAKWRVEFGDTKYEGTITPISGLADEFMDFAEQ